MQERSQDDRGANESPRRSDNHRGQPRKEAPKGYHGRSFIDDLYESERDPEGTDFPSLMQ